MSLKISAVIAFSIAAACFFIVPKIGKQKNSKESQKAEETIPSADQIETLNLAELKDADDHLNRYYSQHDLLKKIGDGDTDELYRVLAAKAHVQQRIKDLKKTN